MARLFPIIRANLVRLIQAKQPEVADALGEPTLLSAARAYRTQRTTAEGEERPLSGAFRLELWMRNQIRQRAQEEGITNLSTPATNFRLYANPGEDFYGVETDGYGVDPAQVKLLEEIVREVATEAIQRGINELVQLAKERSQAPIPQMAIRQGGDPASLL